MQMLHVLYVFMAVVCDLNYWPLEGGYHFVQVVVSTAFIG